MRYGLALPIQSKSVVPSSISLSSHGAQPCAKNNPHLEQGQSFEIRLPKNFLYTEGITDPLVSFKVALQRYADRSGLKYRIYIVDGTIYCVPVLTISKD